MSQLTKICMANPLMMKPNFKMQMETSSYPKNPFLKMKTMCSTSWTWTSTNKLKTIRNLMKKKYSTTLMMTVINLAIIRWMLKNHLSLSNLTKVGMSQKHKAKLKLLMPIFLIISRVSNLVEFKVLKKIFNRTNFKFKTYLLFQLC